MPIYSNDVLLFTMIESIVRTRKHVPNKNLSRKRRWCVDLTNKLNAYVHIIYIYNLYGDIKLLLFTRSAKWKVLISLL